MARRKLVLEHLESVSGKVLGAYPEIVRDMIQGGWEYRANLRTDGTIRYGTKVFDSPHAAAREALKRRRNGWIFWNFKDASGEWVPLKVLKS